MKKIEKVATKIENKKKNCTLKKNSTGVVFVGEVKGGGIMSITPFLFFFLFLQKKMAEDGTGAKKKDSDLYN